MSENNLGLPHFFSAPKVIIKLFWQFILPLLSLSSDSNHFLLPIEQVIELLHNILVRSHQSLPEDVAATVDQPKPLVFYAHFVRNQLLI